MKDCIFCNYDEAKIYKSLKNVFAIYDNYPVNPGHTLVIPKRHVSNFFELSFDEQIECLHMVNLVKDQLLEFYKPDGFNIGINVNEAAGQTIFHAHIHVIPRYVSDVENPRGGVRGVIPGKKDYKK